MVASACLNGTYSLGPGTGHCLMLGDFWQSGANHTEELLKNPSRRARHQDRQRRSPSSMGKHLEALSLESGQMKAPRCTSRQLQGAPEPVLMQHAMFPEQGQGGVTRSESTQVIAYLLQLGHLLDVCWALVNPQYSDLWKRVATPRKGERQEKVALESPGVAPPFKSRGCIFPRSSYRCDFVI